MTNTKELVERLRDRLAMATQGEWELQDGCSWRRIGTAGHSGNVLCPTTHPGDGHLDLCAGKGESLYANLTLIVEAVNALPTLLAALESSRPPVAGSGPSKRRKFADPTHQSSYDALRRMRPNVEEYNAMGGGGNAYAVGYTSPDQPARIFPKGSKSYAHWCAGVDNATDDALATPEPSQGREAAYRNCAEMCRQMAGTIGAFPGLSIFAALEACAERMDDIAAAIRFSASIEGGE